MKERFKKPIKEEDLKSKQIDFVDLHSMEWKNLENFEKHLEKMQKKYEGMLKRSNVFIVPPEIVDLVKTLKNQLKENEDNLKRIKWYHRDKTKARNYFRARIKKLKYGLNYINYAVAKRKKIFYKRIKTNPNYYKEKYEYAISTIKEHIKKVQSLKERVIKSSRREQEIIIQMYKKLLDDLRSGRLKQN